MTYISENIIPGNYGKTFTTNVDDATEKSRLKEVILQVEGIKSILFADNVFPLEFTIHTNEVVNITELQNKVKDLGYHIIAKGPFFPLF